MKPFDQPDNIYRLAEELRLPEKRIMDFSNPVNPLGTSRKVKAEIRRYLKYLHRYPDDDARRLRKKIGQYHSIDPETVLCGNGSAELLYLITRTMNPQKVLIPAPTDTRYERACRASGNPEIVRYHMKRGDQFAFDVAEFIRAMAGKSLSPDVHSHAPGLQEEIEKATHPCDMAFLCNPNDLTGRLLDNQSIKKIADAADRVGCYLIVDEAFIDFSPGESLIQEVADHSHLMVLRSMSQASALAGVRFGYGVFPVHWMEQLASNRPPFMVSILAQQAAAAVLRDKAYRKETQSVVQREKAFLEKSFRKLGITFFPSDANFYLVETASASLIWHRLRRKGIMVKACSDFFGLGDAFLRIAVKSHRENTVLVKELSAILTSGD